MSALVSRGLREGFRRGVIQGSRPWMVVGGIALVLRVVQRLGAKEEAVVYREVLAPGQTVSISNGTPTGGRPG